MNRENRDQTHAENLLAHITGAAPKRETERKRNETRLVDKVGKDGTKQGANQSVAKKVSDARLQPKNSKRVHEDSLQSQRGTTDESPQKGKKSKKPKQS